MTMLQAFGKTRQTTTSSVLLFTLLLFADASYGEDFVELPRDLEVRLALSALPEELQAAATLAELREFQEVQNTLARLEQQLAIDA